MKKRYTNYGYSNWTFCLKSYSPVWSLQSPHENLLIETVSLTLVAKAYCVPTIAF